MVQVSTRPGTWHNRCSIGPCYQGTKLSLRGWGSESVGTAGPCVEREALDPGPQFILSPVASWITSHLYGGSWRHRDGPPQGWTPSQSRWDPGASLEIQSRAASGVFVVSEGEFRSEGHLPALAVFCPRLLACSCVWLWSKAWTRRRWKLWSAGIFKNHGAPNAHAGVIEFGLNRSFDVSSSPDLGLFCHWKLGLSFFTCNKKIYLMISKCHPWF